jgi:hypothetical protein
MMHERWRMLRCLGCLTSIGRHGNRAVYKCKFQCDWPVQFHRCLPRKGCAKSLRLSDSGPKERILNAGGHLFHLPVMVPLLEGVSLIAICEHVIALCIQNWKSDQFQRFGDLSIYKLFFMPSLGHAPFESAGHGDPVIVNFQ